MESPLHPENGLLFPLGSDGRKFSAFEWRGSRKEGGEKGGRRGRGNQGTPGGTTDPRAHNPESLELDVKPRSHLCFGAGLERGHLFP